MGRTFGGSDLRVARRMCRGKAAHRGVGEETCSLKIRRQAREDNDVTDPAVLADAIGMALYYARQ